MKTGAHVRNKPILGIIFLIVVSTLALVPFYIMINMSTHSTQDLYTSVQILPGRELLNNLETVLSAGFLRFYFNSTYTALVSTALSVLVSALAGFGFAKYKFRFNSFLFGFVITCLMIPAQLGLIGYVTQMSRLGLTQTHLPLIIFFIANPFGVFWMTNYIRAGVPDEIIESARMDGCREIGVFFRIVVPYIKPALGTLGIIVFMWSWKNFIIPLVTINSVKLFTIPLGISILGNMYQTDYAAQIAALSVGTVPLIIVFIAGSKYFIKGLTAGAVKG